MADFQLDTSGAVTLGRDLTSVMVSKIYAWPDLDAFTQGCEGAARRELAERLMREGMTAEQAREATAFHRWAPETLATIIRDCSAALKAFPTIEQVFPLGAGREFWIRRQLGRYPAFPPLTPTLGDDGLIYLRAA